MTPDEVTAVYADPRRIDAYLSTLNPIRQCSVQSADRCFLAMMAKSLGLTYPHVGLHAMEYGRAPYSADRATKIIFVPWVHRWLNQMINSTDRSTISVWVARILLLEHLV